MVRVNDAEVHLPERVGQLLGVKIGDSIRMLPLY
jgi:hypothetical protein